MNNPCPRCGVPAPVFVSSDGALPPDLVMADEVARLREALEAVVSHAIGYGIHSTDDYRAAQSKMASIARAALATAKGDK